MASLSSAVVLLGEPLGLPRLLGGALFGLCLFGIQLPATFAASSLFVDMMLFQVTGSEVFTPAIRSFRLELAPGTPLPAGDFHAPQTVTDGTREIQSPVCGPK